MPSTNKELVQAVCGALAECCRNDRNRTIVRYCNIVPSLRVLLKKNEEADLIPVAKLVSLRELVLGRVCPVFALN